MKLFTALLMVPNILWAATQFLFVAAWVLAFPATTASWPWYVLLAPTLVAVGLGVGFLGLVSVLHATLWKDDDVEVVEVGNVELIQLEDGRLALRSFAPPAGSQMLN